MDEQQQPAGTSEATRLECLRLACSMAGRGLYYGGDGREVIRSAAEMAAFVDRGELPKERGVE